VAGTGNRLTVRLVRHRQTKGSVNRWAEPTETWRQSSTLLMSGDRKQGDRRSSVPVPSSTLLHSLVRVFCGSARLAFPAEPQDCLCS
jgi:hypothetical protein